MPRFWPFKKRRRSAGATEGLAQPLSEKPQPTKAATSTLQPGPPIPRRSSRRIGSQRKRPASQQEMADDAQSPETKKRVQTPPGKENMPHRISSIENITALPVSRKLEQSPHLRPVDAGRPRISYNFRRQTGSQTSVERRDTVDSSRPQTLRSKPSAYDGKTPQRRRSSRRKGDQVREEEIRSMTEPIPIPKRAGDGPLRRESKKVRSFGAKDSNVSLPPEGSIHSAMSSIMEQRGFEIGSFAMFGPRPAVRMSGVPQHVTAASAPGSSSPLRSVSRREEKKPMSRDSARKRQTIGNQVDDFDASDLRLLMERDAKRRERATTADREKLDKKLRSRGGRNRGDSDKSRKRRDAEAAKRVAEESERRLMTPPTDIHPAFRGTPGNEEPDALGLGIGEGEVAAGAAMEVEGQERATRDTSENPFVDPPMEPMETPMSEKLSAQPSPLETPQEDETVIETAQAIHFAQAASPPASPVLARAASVSQVAESQVADSQVTDSRRTSDFQPPPVQEFRRASEPPKEPSRRAGAWASFFRRSGTTSGKDTGDKTASSEISFSNTSRESMRNQPLSSHLVDVQSQNRAQLRKSGAPVRTQSKFREDLPEIPISPPDSRLPSPDITTAAAMAAAARRKRPIKPTDIPQESHAATDAEMESTGFGHSDAPFNPGTRGRRLMSTSMASIDSEGSWLASGSPQRHSTQSGLSRSIGSLSKQRHEFSGSTEELSGDKEAEDLRNVASSPDGRRGLHNRKAGSPAIAGASPDEESEYSDPLRPETPGDPLTVHSSLQRRPTLVQREQRMKSREGLITEYIHGMSTPEPASPGGATDAGDDLDSPEPELQNATSVTYGQAHARKISAGSARLLDTSRRDSQPSTSGPTVSKF